MPVAGFPEDGSGVLVSGDGLIEPPHLPAGQTSVTVTPARYSVPLTYFRGQVVEVDPAGPVYTALTGAVTLRALNMAAGTQAAANRDVLGESFAVSNGTP